jgi:hypothetical protein
MYTFAIASSQVSNNFPNLKSGIFPCIITDQQHFHIERDVLNLSVLLNNQEVSELDLLPDDEDSDCYKNFAESISQQ